MRSNIVTPGWIVGLVLAGAVAYVAWAAANGRTLPFVSTPKGALWLVAGLGITACATGGIGLTLARTGTDWTSPWMLVGMVLGTLAVLVLAAVSFGIRVPLIAGEREAMLAVAAIAGLKVAVSVAHTVALAVAR